MKKIAISLPNDQADAVEKLRRKHKVPRSRVIQRAIAYYLIEQGETAAVREYEEAYRRQPEGSEVESYAAATAEVLPAEEWE